MKPPCDEGIIRSAGDGVPCRDKSGPWVLAAAILGSSMAFIDNTVVNVALPALQSSFRTTVVDVQWVIESYGLFLSALILAGGALGDIVGRRLMFVIGVLLFAAASAVCGFSPTIRQLIVGRSIQGIGAALLGKLVDLTSLNFVYYLCSYLPALGILTAFLPNLEPAKAKSLSPHKTTT